MSGLERDGEILDRWYQGLVAAIRRTHFPEPGAPPLGTAYREVLKRTWNPEDKSLLQALGRRHGITRRQWRLVTSALLMGPSWTTGGDLVRLATLFNVRESAWARYERDLERLVSVGLFLQFTKGPDLRFHRFRAGGPLLDLVPLGADYLPGVQGLLVGEIRTEAARAPSGECEAAGAARAVEGVGGGIPAASPAAAAPTTPDVTEVPFGFLERPRLGFQDLVLDDEVKRSIEEAMLLWGTDLAALFPGERASLRPDRGCLTLLFEGPPGTGKTLAAGAIASCLGLPLYRVELPRLIGGNIGESEQNLVKLLTEVASRQVVFLLDEADTLLTAREADMHYAARMHNAMVNQMLQFLDANRRFCIMTTNRGGSLDPALERRLTSRIRFPVPAAAQRRMLWEKHVPVTPFLAAGVDLGSLSERYALTGSRIKNAVSRAIRTALVRQNRGAGAFLGRTEGPPPPFRVERTDLEDSAALEERLAVRDTMSIDSDAAAVGDVRCPRFGLDRVVLPDSMRHAIDAQLVRFRPEARALFESAEFRETFQTGRGVIMLLEGPPGTGKTMTAEAIAGHLGKNLMVTRPDQLRHKWLGQSEKAVSRLFDEARARGALLLLDEADSFLHARHGVHSSADNVSNNVINILLQRIEECEDVIFLTTNRADQLDPALERRISLRLTFEEPGPGDRLRLFMAHVPPGVSLAPGVDPAALLASRRLSGGLIRNGMLEALRRMLLRDPSSRRLEAVDLEESFDALNVRKAARVPGFDLARTS